MPFITRAGSKEPREHPSEMAARQKVLLAIVRISHIADTVTIALEDSASKEEQARLGILRHIVEGIVVS